jgi:hypothetical protein
MGERKLLCFRCKSVKGIDVFMVEKHDLLVCPECKTAIILEGKSPLSRFQDDWKRNAEEVFPLIRPPLYMDDLANPRLFFLYEDCYHTLLIGKYNASIVLMGVLLEALMKERIWLRLGTYFRGAYGDCLQKVKKEKLMDFKDIYYLEKFKNEVRNPYQHADDVQIVEDLGFYRVFPIPIDMSKSVTLQLEKGIEDVRTRRIKPRIIPVTDPLVRDVAKREYDRKHALELFNKVYDFLRVAKIKYFSQEEYDEHQKKFG